MGPVALRQKEIETPDERALDAGEPRGTGQDHRFECCVGRLSSAACCAYSFHLHTTISSSSSPCRRPRRRQAPPLPPWPVVLTQEARKATPLHLRPPTPTIPSATLRNEAITITTLNITITAVATLTPQTAASTASPTKIATTTTMVLMTPTVVSCFSLSPFCA